MRGLLMALALAATALAGCTGSDEPISVSDEGDGTYTFTANVDADSYTWDFGDRIGRAEGQVATYDYDFEAGTVTVRMTAQQGDGRTEYTRTLVVGEGENRPPALVLEAETDWAVVGETVRFSAVASEDPEGDPLRLTWTCFVKQDTLTVHPDHAHGGGGGVPFANPGSGSGASRVANGTLPDPDRNVEGDLCEALQTGGPGRVQTLEGTFDDDGLYSITLIGSDGPNPTISTSFDIYVSAPELRPEPTTELSFDGTLHGGRAGSVQQACDELEQPCDKAVHPFTLDFVAKNFTATLDASLATPGGVSFDLYRNGNIFVDPEGETIAQSAVKPGNYHFEVIVDEGLQATYTVAAVVEWDTDPRTYFE